jgi:hypothetical protein
MLLRAQFTSEAQDNDEVTRQVLTISRPISHRRRARVRPGFQDTSAALASLSHREAARSVERLREILAAHYSDERGVVLDSRSWLITARRRR